MEVLIYDFTEKSPGNAQAKRNSWIRTNYVHSFYRGEFWYGIIIWKKELIQKVRHSKINMSHTDYKQQVKSVNIMNSTLGRN
jgi:hypothetical protein